MTFFALVLTVMACTISPKGTSFAPLLIKTFRNPREFSMLELANKVIELTGSKSNLVRMPLPADDPKQRRPDISIARKELGGWEPKTQLDEGLKRTIAYFDGILSETAAAQAQ